MEEFMLIFRHEDGKKVASPEQIHELRLGLKVVICSRGSTVHSPQSTERLPGFAGQITDH